MALRKIRIEGDPILTKRAKEVKKIDDRILSLLEDMKDTMYENNGVGLASVQVGILKRLVVIDVGDGLYKMINPKILEKGGTSVEIEGCLSIPNYNASVERPEWVLVEYMDENGQVQKKRAEGLFARAISHEIDHLDGILFREKAIKEYKLEDLGKQREEE